MRFGFGRDGSSGSSSRGGRGWRIGDLRALLVPPDWFFAVRAGVELVIGAWLVVIKYYGITVLYRKSY